MSRSPRRARPDKTQDWQKNKEGSGNRGLMEESLGAGGSEAFYIEWVLAEHIHMFDAQLSNDIQIKVPLQRDPRGRFHRLREDGKYDSEIRESRASEIYGYTKRGKWKGEGEGNSNIFSMWNDRSGRSRGM